MALWRGIHQLTSSASFAYRPFAAATSMHTHTHTHTHTHVDLHWLYLVFFFFLLLWFHFFWGAVIFLSRSTNSSFLNLVDPVFLLFFFTRSAWDRILNFFFLSFYCAVWNKVDSIGSSLVIDDTGLYNRVLLGSIIWLPSFTGFYWFSAIFQKGNGVVPSFTGFHRVFT